MRSQIVRPQIRYQWVGRESFTWTQSGRSSHFLLIGVATFSLLVIGFWLLCFFQGSTFMVLVSKRWPELSDPIQGNVWLQFFLRILSAELIQLDSELLNDLIEFGLIHRYDFVILFTLAPVHHSFQWTPLLMHEYALVINGPIALVAYPLWEYVLWLAKSIQCIGSSGWSRISGLSIVEVMS